MDRPGRSPSRREDRAIASQPRPLLPHPRHRPVRPPGHPHAGRNACSRVRSDRRPRCPCRKSDAPRRAAQRRPVTVANHRGRALPHPGVGARRHPGLSGSHQRPGDRHHRPDRCRHRSQGGVHPNTAPGRSPPVRSPALARSEEYPSGPAASGCICGRFPAGETAAQATRWCRHCRGSRSRRAAGTQSLLVRRPPGQPATDLPAERRYPDPVGRASVRPPAGFVRPDAGSRASESRVCGPCAGDFRSLSPPRRRSSSS